MAEYGVTLGQPEKHYRVCLSADASGRKDAAAATLLHTGGNAVVAVRGLPLGPATNDPTARAVS